MNLLLVLLAHADPLEPLWIPETDAVHEARSRAIVGGCLSPDGGVLVFPELGNYFGGTYVFLDAATGADLGAVGGTLAGCDAEGALLANPAGFEVLDYRTAAVTRTVTYPDPRPGGDCGALYAYAWPGADGIRYAVTYAPSPYRGGVAPGPEWGARPRCCVTGVVEATSDVATFTFHDRQTSPGCALTGYVAPRGEQELPYDEQLGYLNAQLHVGDVHLQLWQNDGYVLRRVDGDATVWERTFTQGSPPP